MSMILEECDEIYECQFVSLFTQFVDYFVLYEISNLFLAFFKNLISLRLNIVG